MSFEEVLHYQKIIVALVNTENLVAEIADVKEVLDAILNLVGKTWDDVQKIQSQKKEKKGGFEKRVFVENLKVSKDDPWVKYFDKNSDRYPRI